MRINRIVGINKEATSTFNFINNLVTFLAWNCRASPTTPHHGTVSSTLSTYIVAAMHYYIAHTHISVKMLLHTVKAHTVAIVSNIGFSSYQKAFRAFVGAVHVREAGSDGSTRVVPMCNESVKQELARSQIYYIKTLLAAALRIVTNGEQIFLFQLVFA